MQKSYSTQHHPGVESAIGALQSGNGNNAFTEF